MISGKISLLKLYLMGRKSAFSGEIETMQDRLSRREMLSWVGALFVAWRHPSLPPRQGEENIKALEGRLSQSFPSEIRPLVQKALEQNHHYSEHRLKHSLPEGSEPCTVFTPQRKGR